VNRTNLRIAAVLLALTGLTGCSFIENTGLMKPEFWQQNANKENDYAELGLAELSKGNNVEAQGHFERALKINPNDIYALYGMALMYQNNGQPVRARAYYDAILNMQPRPTEELMVWADKQTFPIVDLAGVNVHLLENGSSVSVGDAASMGMVKAGQPDRPTNPRAMALQQPQSITSLMSPSVSSARPGSMSSNMDTEPMFQDADLNIVARFKTLRGLLDQGLITQEEFLMRRKANLGALLPMVSPPAATGLDRPVPALDQISARLNAIGRALEMRALSPAQHTAERSMILDALMPANPASVSNPVPPPQGLMAAADAVRRLEMLKAADLITSDEYTKERAAIEGSMQPMAPKALGAGEMKPLGGAVGGETKSAMSGFQPGLHLASFRQQKAAERGWTELSKRFASQLGGLEHRIERVDLGNSKGVFYRLKVGPLPSNAAAKDMCVQLKAKRQYCEPTTINFG
jgi:tetratricopeptide (TPR) repeat protein